MLSVGRCGVDVCIIYERERLAKPRLHQFSIKETRSFLKFSFLPERVRFKPKMTSTGYTLYLQQGAGKYEDSEESDFSQESEVSSQGTESSQEETENLAPWLRILDEAEKRHETQLNALINDYEGNGDSENVARVKAENALLPVYRKELRKVLLENLQWMRAMKKDPTFKKVIETQKELKDTEGFDWLESTELAIDKRKFLLNRLYQKQPIPQDED